MSEIETVRRLYLAFRAGANKLTEEQSKILAMEVAAEVAEMHGQGGIRAPSYEELSAKVGRLIDREAEQAGMPLSSFLFKNKN